jgi:hypothetical protein
MPGRSDVDEGAGAVPQDGSLPPPRRLPPPDADEVGALDGFRALRLAPAQTPQNRPAPQLAPSAASIALVAAQAVGQQRVADEEDQFNSALSSLESEAARLSDLVERTEARLDPAAAAARPPARNLMNRFPTAADVTYGAVSPSAVPVRERMQIVQQSLSLANQLASELRERGEGFLVDSRPMGASPFRSPSQPSGEAMLAELFLKVRHAAR